MKLYFFLIAVVALVTVAKPSLATAGCVTEPVEMTHEYGITYDQVVNLPAMKKGGSDLFYFYVFEFLNHVHESLQGKTDDMDPKHKELFRYFCYDSGCDKGLDLAKIRSSDIFSLLTFLSTYYPPNCASERQIGSRHFEAVAFLQGLLAPFGFNPYHFSLEQEKKAEHISVLGQFLDQLKLRDIKKIIVNLPDQSDYHYDVISFLNLGYHIKERQMDLHIIRCGTYCANYLLPAARAVYIEPYGYIHSKGTIDGRFNNAFHAAKKERDYWIDQLRIEWLPGQSESDMVQFIKSHMTAAFGFPPPPQKIPDRHSRKEMARGFQKSLTEWIKAVWGDEKWELFSKTVISDYETHARKKFKDFRRKNISGFVESMNTDKNRSFLKDMAIFFKMHTEDNKERLDSIGDYVKTLEWLFIGISDYLLKVTTVSKTGYSYWNVLKLTGYLARDRHYERLFSVPRTYYTVPEKDRPYDVVVPSADILRALGLPVTGENSKEMLRWDFENRVLYLDERKIQSCKFFASGASYTDSTLEKCLSRSE